MDPNRSTSAPRKVKFAPKAPRRIPKPVQPKTEIVNDDADDDEAARAALLHKVNERLGRRGPKVEKKSAARVAFSHEAASTTSIRSFGRPREQKDERHEGSSSEGCGREIVDSMSLNSRTRVELNESYSNPVIASTRKAKKVYREPWDYERTYYPTVLPLRRPYSGDPEILDKEEFGESAVNLEYDEDAINTASELGLLGESENPQMLFLQLPPNLPINKQFARSQREKGKEKATASEDASGGKGKEKVGASKQGSSLEGLQGGYMGKLLVYKSGAVKLKLGDNLFDVSGGSSCIFAQDVAAINTVDKTCCMLGELSKRAVVTPEIDSLLDKLDDLV